MALAWKVKKWSVSGSVDVESSRQIIGVIDDDNGHFDYTTDLTYNSAFDLPAFDLPMMKDLVNPCMDEKDIVSVFAVSEGFGFPGLRNNGFDGGTSSLVDETASYSFTTVIVPTYPGTPPIPLSGGDSGVFSNPLILTFRLFGNSTNAEYVMFNANQFYPYIISGSFLSAEYYTALRFSEDSTGTDGAVLTIDPVVAPVFTVPLKVTANSGASAHVIEEANVAVQMTAVEFWEYND